MILNKKQLQQKEVLLNLSKGRNDAVFFCEYWLDVKLHDGQKLFLWASLKQNKDQVRELLKKKYPHNYEEALEYIWTYPKLIFILVPSNRWGKTVSLAIKHLYMLFYKINLECSSDVFNTAKYQTFNISPVAEQALNCYEIIVDILHSKFRSGNKINACKIGGMYVSDNKNNRTIEFTESRKFKCSTLGNDTKGATAIQGKDYGYGSFDECSEADRLMLEIPRMQSRLIDMGGSLDLVGTPSSDSKAFQQYFHIAKAGKRFREGYFTIEGFMEENKFLNKETVAQEKEEFKNKFPHLYRQVFFGDFVTSGGKMFSGAEVNQIWDEKIVYSSELPPVDFAKSKNRIFAIDWGFAEQGDPTVGYVIDYTTVPYKVLFHFEETNADPWKLFAYARQVKEHFDCKLIMDTNAMGGNIISKLLKDLHPIHFDFHGKTKEDGLYLLKQALSHQRDYKIDDAGCVVENNPNFGKLRSYYIPELEEQLGVYRLDDKKLKQDHVMTVMMAIYHIDRRPPIGKPTGFNLFGRKSVPTTKFSGWYRPGVDYSQNN